jgi:hypothetical protein
MWTLKGCLLGMTFCAMSGAYFYGYGRILKDFAPGHSKRGLALLAFFALFWPVWVALVLLAQGMLTAVQAVMWLVRPPRDKEP